MWLVKLAWKNMWRNRNRTLITMAAIFFAVILSVMASSLQDGIFNNLVKNVVSFYTGYVQVHKQGYWDEQILDKSLADSSVIAQEILSVKKVKGVTSRLESFALASSEDITRGALVVGIEPEKEKLVTLLDSKITQGVYIPEGERAVLIAEGLAERLKLKLGDTVVLIGQGYHGATAAGKYPIRGILKFGSPDLNEKALFMPMAAAQEFFEAYGRVTSYIISMTGEKDLAEVASGLRNRLGDDYEVMTWEEIMPDIKQHIEADANNMKYVQGILYMLICFGIFGTLLMMMMERKVEMGMLVAIGMNKARLIFLLMVESILTVTLGCLLGMLASIPLVYYLSRHPIRMGGDVAEAYERFGFEAIFPTSTDAYIFLNQGLVVLVIGLMLSLYPMYKVIRLDPVTAMRR